MTTTTTILILIIILIMGSLFQESDEADGRHVVGLTRDANILVEQLRRIVQPDPCRWHVVLWPWWIRRIRCHHSRTKNLGARVRARRFAKADREHDRRDAHVPQRFARGFRTAWRSAGWLRKRGQAPETVQTRVEASRRERSHIRIGTSRDYNERRKIE